jgi:hypothetical protein
MFKGDSRYRRGSEGSATPQGPEGVRGTRKVHRVSAVPERFRGDPRYHIGSERVRGTRKVQMRIAVPERLKRRFAIPETFATPQGLRITALVSL